MAQKIIRLPRSLAHLALRFANAVITFLFVLFVYATGQAGQGTSSNKQTSQTGLAGFMKALNISSAIPNPVPLYGVTPDYGITPLYGPVVEYGMPWAAFSVKGTIKSKESALGIQNIKVTLRDTTNKLIAGSAVTAQNGSFSISFSSTNPPAWVMKASDTIGSFLEKDTLISIPPESLKGGNGWYLGSGEANVTLYLNTNATAVRPGTGKTYADQPEVKVSFINHGTISVRYGIARSGQARVALYDMSGGLVRELANRRHSAGENSISFETAGLAAGTYFLKVQANDCAVIVKIPVAR